MTNSLGALRLHEADGVVSFAIKVVPGASRTRIMGLHGPALRLAVAACPEAGKANREALRYLAKRLGVRSGDLTIASGETSPRKRIAVRGLTAASLRARLGDEG